MPRFGFVGPSYTPWSTAAESQRTVNLYPEKIESNAGKNAYALFGTPGITPITTTAILAVTAGGGGYTLNDVLTVVGGTGTTAMTIKVLTLGGGNSVATAQIKNGGNYSVYPTNPVSVTGGTGTLATFTITWGQEIKGMYHDVPNNRDFAAVRYSDGQTRLVEFNRVAGELTDRGQLFAAASSKYPVSFSTNGTQLFIVDSGDLVAFCFTLATNTLTDVTASVGNTNPIWGEFMDGYFIALCDDGKVYISSLYDGTTWDVLDTATPESSPDTCTMIAVYQGNLWLFGYQSYEVWANTGAADFPFEPIRNATNVIGLVWPYSVCKVGDTMIWLGRVLAGGLQFFAADGYAAKRVSNHAAENTVSSGVDFSTIPSCSWSYEWNGHFFYLISIGTTTLCYDMATQMWHERVYMNGSSEESHRGRCFMYAGGSADLSSIPAYVGDRSNGQIYWFIHTQYSDRTSGALVGIRRERRAAHLANEQKRFLHHRLQLEIEANASTYTLEYSDDNGSTWSTAVDGRANYSNRGREWRRLGSSRDRIYRVRTTGATKQAWIDAYLEMEPCNF